MSNLGTYNGPQFKADKPKIREMQLASPGRLARAEYSQIQALGTAQHVRLAAGSMSKYVCILRSALSYRFFYISDGGRTLMLDYRGPGFR